MNEHASPGAPPAPEASGAQWNSSPAPKQPLPASHASGSSGLHTGRHSASTPWLVITHEVFGVLHTGDASEHEHCSMQWPMLVSPSTPKHIAPSSQSSMPETPLPSTVHASPTVPGSSAIGVQRVAFHELPPSFAHGIHFSPPGQSCAKMSQSSAPPASGSSMKP